MRINSCFMYDAKNEIVIYVDPESAQDLYNLLKEKIREHLKNGGEDIEIIADLFDACIKLRKELKKGDNK